MQTAENQLPRNKWEMLPFDQVAIPQSDQGKRVKHRDYLPAGRLPVIDQGQEFIGGYVDDLRLTFEGELPVILFGDHTRTVKFVDRPFAVGAEGIKIFRPSALVTPRYLFHWMRAAKLPDRGYGRHYQYLRQLRVPAPPIVEQEGIVAEIEKQFSRLDEAVANLKRVKANLKRYKAAVLKAAVEGRLAPAEAELARKEGRTYETSKQLLARVLKERRAAGEKQNAGSRKKKYVEPRQSSTTILPDLPEGWLWASFGQVAERVTVGHVGPMKNEYIAKGVPFLRSQNVRANRFDSEGLKFISQEFHRKLAKSALKPGDIVVVRSGSVGVSCVIPQNLIEANCSDLVIVKSPIAVLPSFGSYYMNSVIETRVASGKVGVALTHFNTQSVAEMPIPVPPLAEQNRIVTEADRHFSIAEELETQVNVNLQRVDRLRQTILLRAFQ